MDGRPVRRRLLGAVTVALIASAALAGCTVTGTPAPPPTALEPGSVSAQEVCDRADSLTRDGRSDDALALIEEYRDGVPTPVPTVTRRATTTPTSTPTPVVDCEPERLSALDASGQAAASDSAPSPAESFAEDWDRIVASVVLPLLPVLATAAVAFLVLLLLARLGALLPGMPWFGGRTGRSRGLLAAVGTAIAAASALLLAICLASAFWWSVVFAVTGLVGSVLLAVYLSGRVRIAIEVREKDKSVREASARVIALLQSMAASPPRGVEVPIGSDVTALADAIMLAPATNPIVQVLRWLATTVLATTPWRVLVSMQSDRASVIVTRNGRVVAAHEVDPVRLFSEATSDPAEALASPPAVGAEVGVETPAPPVLLPFVHECAAAVVVIALAEQYDGFESLRGGGAGGGGSWESLALQYVATTAFAHDPVTQRRLLATALDADPANLPAEVALQHSLRRSADKREDMVAYLDWLDARIGSLLSPPPAPRVGERAPEPVLALPADEDVRHISGEAARPGSLDLVRRLLLSYVATSLNLRALGGGDGRRERNARRLVELLGDSTPPSGGLRDRMRLHAGLMYVEVVPAEKGTGSQVDRWHSAALRSSSPSVAYNGACYFSTPWEDRLSGETKQSIEARVRERLQYALVLPELRVAARHDPALAHHRGHPWFEELIDEYERSS